MIRPTSTLGYAAPSLQRSDFPVEAMQNCGFLPIEATHGYEFPLPSAVVVGASLNGLGVIRSLGSAKVPTAVVGAQHWQPAMWSRLADKVAVVQLHGTPLVQCLLQLRRRYQQDPVLLLTDEMAVYTVSERREVLEKSYRFLLPSAEAVDVLSDKIHFHRMAEAAGLPVPRSRPVEGPRDLTKLAELDFPAIVKVADKRVMHWGLADSVENTSNLQSAIARCRELLPTAGRLIVQERVPGPGSEIYFCLFYCGQDGKPVSIFTGRKLRSYPATTGRTVICVAAPEARHQLEPLTRRLIDQVGFFGLGGVEYKWHPLEKRFVIIEPTVGRTDWQEEIASLCGNNIPLNAYRDAVGLPPVPVPASDEIARVAWRETVVRRWPSDAPGAPTRIYDGYWRIDDPIPAFAYYGGAWLVRGWRLLRDWMAALGSARLFRRFWLKGVALVILSLSW